MEDVARAVGCSRATVSFALRKHACIPEATRRRVEEAAARLGYRTNPLVSALMTLHRQRKPDRARGTVMAYLTTHQPDNPWRRHPPYVGIFDGAVERGTELGYKVEEFKLGAAGMTPARMRRILLTRNIHGLIVAPLPRREVSIDFDFASFAAVGIGLSVHHPLIERVANDHFQSAALAVETCAARGYRRIGLAISRETSLRLDHRWLAGCQFAVSQRPDLEPIAPLMTERSDELAEVIPQWVRSRQLDVVILDNSYRDFFRRIPLTVGVVSLTVERPDDAISGIYQNYNLIGRVAFEHAAAKLYTSSFGCLNEAHVHSVAGIWVDGQTTPGPGRKRPEVSGARKPA